MSGFSSLNELVRWKPKTRDAVLEYEMDWRPWLKGIFTITGAVWTNDPGITLSDPSHTATHTQAFIAGGVLGEKYQIKCTITRNDGAVESRVFVLRILERGD